MGDGMSVIRILPGSILPGGPPAGSVPTAYPPVVSGRVVTDLARVSRPGARSAWRHRPRPGRPRPARDPRSSTRGSSGGSGRRRSTSTAPRRSAGRSAARRAAAEHLRAGRAAFERFLDGDLDALDALPIDLGGPDRAGTALVLGAVPHDPARLHASYGEVARMIGKAGAARAVGGAVGRNPIGLVIPCHRVIAGDGTLGGYGGGWWGGRQAGPRAEARAARARGRAFLAGPSRAPRTLPADRRVG